MLLGTARRPRAVTNSTKPGSALVQGTHVVRMITSVARARAARVTLHLLKTNTACPWPNEAVPWMISAGRSDYVDAGRPRTDERIGWNMCSSASSEIRIMRPDRTAFSCPLAIRRRIVSSLTPVGDG